MRWLVGPALVGAVLAPAGLDAESASTRKGRVDDMLSRIAAAQSNDAGATAVTQAKLQERRAGGTSLLESGSELHDTMQCKVDCQQDRKLVQIEKDLKQSDKDLNEAENRHNLYKSQLMDMQDEYLKHLDTVAVWRTESAEMWEGLRKMLKDLVDNNIKKENVELQKVKDVLESTFGAVASMFQYEVAKMGQAKHQLTTAKKSVLEADKMYTAVFDSVNIAYEKELMTTTNLLYAKQDQLSEYYDNWISGARDNMQAELAKKNKDIAKDDDYMNKLMFLGGAVKKGTLVQTGQGTDLEADRKLSENMALKKGYSPSGRRYRRARGLLETNATDDDEDEVLPLAESLAQLDEHSLAQHRVTQKFVKAVGNWIGNAAKAMVNWFKGAADSIFNRRRRKPGPPPPVILPALKIVEEQARNDIEDMEDKVSVETTGILSDEQKLERAVVTRDKKFQAKMGEMERLAQEESGRMLATVENQWADVLNKHQKSLAYLEMLLTTKIGQIVGRSKDNYIEGNMLVKETKKDLLGEIKAVARTIKVTQRKMESFVSASKEAVGTLRVDIAKEGTAMDIAADTAKQDAKRQEKETSAEIVNKFNGFNQEIDSAGALDLVEGNQVKGAIDSILDTTAVEAKSQIADLKDMTKQFHKRHKQMFQESLTWQEQYNDNLKDLGDDVIGFTKECAKEINKDIYAVEGVRAENADGLASQLNTLTVLGTKALQDMQQAEMEMKDNQNRILDGASEALRRNRENDQISLRSAQSEADRAMTSVQGAIDRSGRRHDKNVNAAKDIVKQLEDQIPPTTATVDRANTDVKDMTSAAEREYASIKKGFETKIEQKFSQGQRLMEAQIQVDSETAQRELNKAIAEYSSTSGDLSKELEGLVSSMQRGADGFAEKEAQAHNQLTTVQKQQKTTTSQITNAYTALEKGLETDESARQERNNAIHDAIEKEGDKMVTVAEKDLGGATADEEAAFDKDLDKMGAKITKLSKETDEAFGDKQRQIQEDTSILKQQESQLESQEDKSKREMENIDQAEDKARKAAAIAAQHAEEAMSDEAKAAQAAEAESESQREDRLSKLQSQVRSQGHFASERLQSAMATVAEDAQAQIDEIQKAEHLTEREKKEKIARIEMAAADVIQEMAATEAAKGEGLTAFELMATKWGDNLAEHIDDLASALQTEESQRASKLASNKADLADMSERFHESVKQVKEAVERAHKEGRIVLTPEELQELHDMEANAHQAAVARRADAEKELRIAELSKQRAERGAEMTEEELMMLSNKLAGLTGTVSGGVSMLKARQSEAERARQQALQAQEHFAAAGVGQGLDAVSKMAEFLLAATRVSGMKEKALQRQAKKFSEALASPLANIQSQLGIKTKQAAKNEAEMEGMVGEAKAWDAEFEKRKADAEMNGEQTLANANKALEDMPTKLANEISEVEGATSKALADAMKAIENEAGFDAQKAEQELKDAGSGQSRFAGDLEAGAKHSMEVAEVEMQRIKQQELARLERLDGNDDELAASVLKLEERAVAMRQLAQKLSSDVSSAVAKQVSTADAKRKEMGQKLGDLNARVHAMAGVSRLEVDAKGDTAPASLLETQQASDAELERLAEELEQHTAQEAKKTSEAEQVNQEVRKLISF